MRVYKTLALTPIHIPFIPKAYIYPTTLVGPIMLLVAIYLLFFTRFGRTIYAMGNNEQSALLMGLPVASYKDFGLCVQRPLFSSGRNCLQHVIAGRLWTVCNRDGA